MSFLGCLPNRLPEIRTPSCVKDKLQKSYHFKKGFLLFYCSCCERRFIVVAIFFLGGGVGRITNFCAA